jgi:D-glycero-beta-D-manno-heptose 1-phosphate adenylyltransferase
VLTVPARVVLDRAELTRLLDAERAAGRTIVLANGCFDLIHVGHVRYLEGAKLEGDVLVVALNSDASVRRNKGEGRPLQPEGERVEILASFGCVDFVTVFDEPTADALIRALRPAVHAKGTEWREDNVPEVATVRAIGGRVAIVGDAKSHSSTELAARAASKD